MAAKEVGVWGGSLLLHRVMYHKGEGREIIRVPSQERSRDSWDISHLQSALASSSVLICQRISRILRIWIAIMVWIVWMLTLDVTSISSSRSHLLPVSQEPLLLWIARLKPAIARATSPASFNPLLSSMHSLSSLFHSCKAGINNLGRHHSYWVGRQVIAANRVWLAARLLTAVLNQERRERKEGMRGGWASKLLQFPLII